MLKYFLLAAHSPDNSFMGFVVERHVETPTLMSNVSDAVKKNQAVVYGKAEYMWSVSMQCYFTSINHC